MSPERRTPAYRKGATIDRVVLTAARELLETEGLGGARVADIAAAAGVHETSIYRRWGSRTKLIAAALSGHVDTELELPDTGSTRNDLIAFYTALAEFLATPAGRSVTALFFTAARDESCLEEARTQFWDLRLDRARLLVQRGIERAELDPDVNPEIVVESVAGALNLHILLRNRAADHGYIGALVDLALDGARHRLGSQA
ncbi:TetR/AcrR family transcriptional regulator C-terminal ligand-binding domain-containing protein [Mycobacteroides abscessus subsp. bolletii]|uniref:TetR-like C-terminal domain-containing protein n=1 Tax=Mycobacteroides abscessus TaxID=36809 RepID=UPI0019D24915|nr:TetR-like C-terminal domain-containing protein [Mycobacteroides abscessus]MBN7300800.1 TetR/AcrR family transcriptional regulator C-terminal ligand-binding domain-containing protein [Mycobacteroides abscessus subsp. bolletii]